MKHFVENAPSALSLYALGEGGPLSLCSLALLTRRVDPQCRSERRSSSIPVRRQRILPIRMPFSQARGAQTQMHPSRETGTGSPRPRYCQAQFIPGPSERDFRVFRPRLQRGRRPVLALRFPGFSARIPGFSARIGLHRARPSPSSSGFASRHLPSPSSAPPGPHPHPRHCWKAASFPTEEADWVAFVQAEV